MHAHRPVVFDFYLMYIYQREEIWTLTKNVNKNGKLIAEKSYMDKNKQKDQNMKVFVGNLSQSKC